MSPNLSSPQLVKSNTLDVARLPTGLGFKLTTNYHMTPPDCQEQDQFRVNPDEETEKFPSKDKTQQH